MKKTDWLTKNFEDSRAHLKSVAYQMLGSTGEAEDAVQEAWIRLNRTESEEIENIRGWLTTVVSRVCLDILRSRKSKREESLDDVSLNKADQISDKTPESENMIADLVGPALLLILDQLTPTERIAFVLHDIFDISFEEIGPIIDRTADATRQLASRARRRIKGVPTVEDISEKQKEMVSAFLSASRNGNFHALIQLLHPEAVLRADQTAINISLQNKERGAPQFTSQMKGAQTIANTFKGKASAAQLALINGQYAGTWAPAGKPVVVFSFTCANGQITAIDIVMNPETLDTLMVDLLESDKIK